MVDWSQPALPFNDPVTVLPRDGRARMIFAWRGKSGRLNRQWACEVDDVPTVRHLLRAIPDVFDTQWWMDRPIRRHAFALAGTHAYADLDTYRVRVLAGQTLDAIGKTMLRHCDDTGIPRPSAIVSSGRGIHAKWCFAEPVGREHVGKMVSVNRALARKLTAFGADATATDATRLLRVTGSLHSGAGRMVEVLHLEQRDGRTITYDPHALAEQLVPRTAEAPEPGTVLPTAADLHREARRDHDVVRHRFTREGWHWALIEDMRLLPVIRYRGGMVPEGMRDTFAFLIACQAVRIFQPGEVFSEIAAIVSTIVAPDFVGRHLLRLCSTAMRRARDAHAGRSWIHTYRYGKQTMIDLLQITQAEMRQMRALIDEAEYRRRHAARERAKRAVAGALPHADRAERRATAAVLRAEGLSWAKVAERTGLPSADAARKLAERA